ncbi:MAG: hypothetical protein SGPRY_007701, partial [Prymnesium sp.]
KAAVAVASRCVLVRGVYEVWAEAEPQEEEEEPWDALASAVCAAGEEERRKMLEPLRDESWKMTIETFGARKPYSLRRKVALFELFDSLLQELPGEVDLAQPEHVIAMIEDACAPAALTGKA